MRGLRSGSRLAGLVAAAIVTWSLAPLAHAQLKLEWNTEGYYRARAISISNLAPEPRVVFNNATVGLPIVQPEIRSTSYMTQRLRLNPPYREHLSQAFARFCMRVGLPVDIPPFVK